MNDFVDNLKTQASENPIVAIAAGAALLSATGKFIEQIGHYKGSTAFAKQVNAKLKNSKK